MSEIRVNSLGNESNTGGPVLSGITEFSGQQYFIPPKGNTAERPSDCPPGSIRFNTDSSKLEYWNGLVWLEFEASSVELGNNNLAEGRSGNGTGTRGLVGGGGSPGSTYQDEIEYVTIATLGDGQDFGDLSIGGGRQELGALASSTRGVFCGGTDGSLKEEIEFVTIASTGNSQDFGNIQQGNKKEIATLSNETRGIIAGAGSDVISYITIASTGNDVDFGNMPDTNTTACFGAASPVRGVIAGGSMVDTIRFLTISSTGNAVDFGNLTDDRYAGGSFSNSIRAVFGGGWSPSKTDIIDFITISSTGNATDFGNLTQAKYLVTGCASSTRGLFLGGHRNPSPHVREIDTVEIMSTGNATDFGDISHAVVAGAAGCSNGHGGL